MSKGWNRENDSKSTGISKNATVDYLQDLCFRIPLLNLCVSLFFQFQRKFLSRGLNEIPPGNWFSISNWNKKHWQVHHRQRLYGSTCEKTNATNFLGNWFT